MAPDAHEDAIRRFFANEDAVRFSFDTVDGRHCEGYPLDDDPHRFLFGSGGPMAPEEPEWIPYLSIRLDRLDYWSESAKHWLHFDPNEL
jgi:hypothetical protein